MKGGTQTMLMSEIGRFETDWSVWDDMRELQRDMDRLFSGTFVTYAQDFPSFNVWMNEDKVIVSAEVPGIDTKTIDITVKGDVLTISGDRTPDEMKEGETYLRQERGHGRFTRSIRVPYQIDDTRVEARYDKGILKIELPRAEADKPKKIEIKMQ
jgi:HSP20 family protein